MHLRHFITLALLSYFVPVFYVSTSNSAAFLTARFNLYHYIEGATLFFISGLVAFIVGAVLIYLVKVKTHRNGDVARPNRLLRQRKIAKLIWCGAVCGMTAIVATSPAGFFATIAALQTKVNNAAANQTLLLVLSTMAVASSFFAAFISFSSKGRVSRADWIVIAITIVACFAIGSRYRGVLVAAAPIYLLYSNRKIKLRWVLLAGVLAMVAVNALLAVRAAAQGQLGYLHGYGFIEQFFAQWSIFDGLPIAGALSSTLPVTPTQALQNALLWFLPESIVGQKELVATMAARLLLFGDQLGGITIGLWGEALYYFGGITGTLYLFLLGLLFAAVARASKGHTLFSAACFLSISIFLLGSLRNGLFNDLITYYVVFLTWFACVGMEAVGSSLSVLTKRTPAKRATLSPAARRS